MTARNTILACDVGGTRIKLGIVRGSRLLGRGEISAQAHRGLADAVKRIGAAAKVLLRRTGMDFSDLKGFGLTFPGIIEPGTEKILSSPAGKFDDARSIDVPALVRGRLNLPVRVCNDANAALLGEWRYGAARGFRSAVMMTLGTGIGSSAIIDGVPLRGPHGSAGILGGHGTINLEGGDCICGNAGCAESEISAWVLPEQLRQHPGFSESQMARQRHMDFAAVFRCAAESDRLAIEFRQRALRVWSVVLVNLIHAYDPEAAIVGGGVMRSGNMILPALRRHVARRAWTPWGQVKIMAARLGNDAGMLGVASLFGDFQ